MDLCESAVVTGTPAPASHVPELRGELNVSFQGKAGARKAIIYDPLSHRYYELSRQSTMLLQNWPLGTQDAILKACQRVGHVVSESAIETLSQFLVLNGLARHPGAAQGFSLWHMQQAQKKTFQARFSALLFFRIPLGSPDRLISVLYSIAWPLLTPVFRWLSFTAFLCAFWLLSSMPTTITQHLSALISLQGAPELLIALAVVKLCHELGHGLQAKRLGLRVPSSGIMFLLGLPLPFVELSSAWQLESTKDRLRIDAGGILAELAVAAWCLLAFAFWPDGTTRSILFAMATSSIALTLIVNLNPLMRFDGYFLLSDAIGIKNLQNRALAVMKWRLREALFDLKEACPEPWPPRTRRRLIGYGVALVLYRITLYVGIALMAYALLNKVFGLAVFVFQIVFFIALPVLKEMQVWWKRRADIAKRRRVWRSLAGCALIVAFFMTPFTQHFTVPARLGNGLSSDYFAPRSSVLIDSAYAQGAHVVEGEALWQFSNPDITASIAILQSKIAALDGRIERLASDFQTRAQAPIFQGEKERLLAELETQLQKQNELNIAANASGQLVALEMHVPKDQTAPLALAPDALLGSVVTPATASLKALIPSRALAHIPKDASGQFRSGLERIGPQLPRNIQIVNIQIENSPVSEVTLPEAVQRFGGLIKTDPQNPMQPQESWYSASGIALEDLSALQPMSISGELVIKGQKRSYAERIWSQISLTLIQQIGN